MAFLAPVAGIISAAGAVRTASANARAAKYQAQIAENNAKIAEQHAQYALQEGEANAQQESLKAGARNSSVRAAMASNGVDVNTGSAVDVQASSAALGRLSTENVIHDARLRSAGYEEQARDLRAQSGLYKRQAKSARTSGAIQSVNSFIKTATPIISKNITK